MNVLEAAREVQKDGAEVFKAGKYEIKESNACGIVLNVFGEAHIHIPVGLIEVQDLDFQLVQDLTKLKVDDPIEVSNNGKDWEPAHFLSYDFEKKLILAGFEGRTSRTNAFYNYVPQAWNYWRLPESK